MSHRKNCNWQRAIGALVLTTSLTSGQFAAAAEAKAALPPATVEGAAGVKVYSYADLAEKLLPAVVNISTTMVVTGNNPEKLQVIPGMPGGEGQSPEDLLPQLPPGSPFEDFFRDFLERHGGEGGQFPKRTQTALGSGFIIDAKNGYIVTNNHVVMDGSDITVTLSNNDTLKAKLVGRDQKTDIAVIQVTGRKDKLVEVPWGNSDKMRVGDPVLAVGNPFGLSGTVTSGIISARARHINAGPYDDFIQTDASINRGNSGGPMFNVNGEVIGVNTAIFSPSGGSVGIGFAIPANLASSVVNQIVKYGHTKRGWLGVKIQAVNDEVADSLKLDKADGALVAGVSPNGPAEKAGLQAGDVIMKFDGKPVAESTQLPRLVAETEIGKEVDVEVWRKGQMITKRVKLGELEKAEKDGILDRAPVNKQDLGEADQTVNKSLGLALNDITPQIRQKYNIQGKDGAVVITRVLQGSGAADRGLATGDVILEINQEGVDSVKSALAAIARAQKEGRKYVLLLVSSKGELRYVTLPLESWKDSK